MKLRHILFWPLVLLSVIYIGAQACAQAYGAAPPEGVTPDLMDKFAPLVLAFLGVGTAWVLATILFCGGRELGRKSGFGRTAFVVLLLLVSVEIGNFVFVRGGLQKWALRRDATEVKSTEKVAWEKQREMLHREVVRLESTPLSVLNLDERIDAQRDEISEMLATAHIMDNDGISGNDGQVKGLVAEAESKKADLGNLMAEKDRMTDRHRERIAIAEKRLEQHEASLGAVLGGVAVARGKRHQFAHFGKEIAAMRDLEETAAFGLVLNAVTSSVMLFQYGILYSFAFCHRLKQNEELRVVDVFTETIPSEVMEEPAPPLTLAEVASQVNSDHVLEPFDDLKFSQRRNLLRQMVRAFVRAGFVTSVRSDAVQKMEIKDLEEAYEQGVRMIATAAFARQSVAT